MSAAFIGLDLAKSVFQVHGVDVHGKVVVTKRLRRDAVLAFFANLPVCVIGMEACAGSHFWARELAGLGHTGAPRVSGISVLPHFAWNVWSETVSQTFRPRSHIMM